MYKEPLGCAFIAAHCNIIKVLWSREQQNLVVEKMDTINF